MRTWGRTYDSEGAPTWVVVETTADGFDDFVWLTTLIQTLQLNLGESPFYANYGIPAKPSVVQQVWPDFNVTLTQQLFSPHFAALIVSKENSTTPTYKVNVTTHQGVRLSADVAIAK